jgi:hypothetical protein
MSSRITRVCCALLLTGTPALGQTVEPPAAPACEQAPGENRSAVVGRLVDTGTRLPLQEARVVVEWGRTKAEVESDADGVYRACDLPAGQRVRVTASFGSASDNRDVELASAETHQVDLELDAPRSRAAGRVVEHGTSRGIEAAELRIPGSDVRAVSGPDGNFQLPDVPAGRYPLETSHIGFGTRTDSVEVRYGAIMRYTIGLAVDVIELDPITVAVRSLMLERRGFYERRDRGFGRYLTRQDWDDRALIHSSDVLRTVPGVRIMPRRAGGYLVLDRTNCAYRYVVDGVRVSEGFNIDDIPPDWIEALEIYAGSATIPPEFRMSPFTARSNCGVIVIWTRDTL